MFGWDWSRSRMECERLSSDRRPLVKFSEDLRGGGTGATLASCLLLCWSLIAVARIVEVDEDEFVDSLSAVKPCRFVLGSRASFDALPALLRVTGGLLSAGLGCLVLEAGKRMGATSPGDTEDMEVGVVSRLYEPGPGDSEYLVEGLPVKVLWLLLVVENKGVGGGRSVVIWNGRSK